MRALAPEVLLFFPHEGRGVGFPGSLPLTLDSYDHS